MQRADIQDLLAWMKRAKERARVRQAEDPAENAKRLQGVLADDESVVVERKNGILLSKNAGLAKNTRRLFGVTDDGSPFTKDEDRNTPPRWLPVRKEIASREMTIETDKPGGSAQRNAQ